MHKGPARADLQNRIYFRNKLQLTQRRHYITPHVTVTPGEINVKVHLVLSNCICSDNTDTNNVLLVSYYLSLICLSVDWERVHRTQGHCPWLSFYARAIPTQNIESNEKNILKKS